VLIPESGRGAGENLMAESADRSLTPCNPIPAQDRATIGVGADKQKIRITVRLIRLFGGTPAGFSFPVPETEGILTSINSS